MSFHFLSTSSTDLLGFLVFNFLVSFQCGFILIRLINTPIEHICRRHNGRFWQNGSFFVRFVFLALINLIHLIVSIKSVNVLLIPVWVHIFQVWRTVTIQMSSSHQLIFFVFEAGSFSPIYLILLVLTHQGCLLVCNSLSQLIIPLHCLLKFNLQQAFLVQHLLLFSFEGIDFTATA